MEMTSRREAFGEALLELLPADGCSPPTDRRKRACSADNFGMPHELM
jgi:hypothetical protein